MEKYSDLYTIRRRAWGINEDRSPPPEAGLPCATWRLRLSATIHLELGRNHSGAVAMVKLWD